MKIAKKVWNFIVWHPLWAIIITWITAYLINSMSNGGQTPQSTLILTLITYLFLSIFIRKSRDKYYAAKKAEEERIQKEKDMDLLAQKIAKEQDKITHPERYQN